MKKLILIIAIPFLFSISLTGCVDQNDIPVEDLQPSQHQEQEQ